MTNIQDMTKQELIDALTEIDVKSVKIKKITKQQLFELLGETPTETNKIDDLSIHLPRDPNMDDYIFNYMVNEIDLEETSEEVIL